jgi:hypothetical protein
MFERYRGPLLAGLIFAAFLISFLALVRPRAFAQTMGEYGGILNNSTSDDHFRPLRIRPSQDLGSRTRFKSDTRAGKSANEFKPSTDRMKSDTFKAGTGFDTRDDFKTGDDFKSSDSFKPSFKN